MKSIDKRPLGILISFDLYQVFQDALEELENLAAAEEALRDPSPNLPWDEVKRDLGLL